jgi:hypothetical protein
MSATWKTGLPWPVRRPTVKPRTKNRFVGHYGLIATAAFSILAANSPAQGLKNVIPKDQKPLLKVLPPAPAEQTRPGTGKFVIFSREPVGKEWDFIAGAWECIPSRPDVPITKRVEFCHSSWNCASLLDTLVADDSNGMHPRFARLQVDSDRAHYSVNLYDINYRTWDVRCIWQGSRLGAFGVMGDSIFCRSADGWLLINAASGKLSQEIPFVPLKTDGDFWLVRKPGHAEGCWSYDRKKQQYVAHFGPVDEPVDGFSRSKLSLDGKSRAWVLAPVPNGWQGGALAGRLILQRNGENEDVSVPIEMQASAGSGVPVIPKGIQLTFSSGGKLWFRARMGDEVAKDRVWTIDIATGKVHSDEAPHSEPAKDAWTTLRGVPVPDYLRQEVRDFGHFGRDGLAPAFLLHLGVLKEKPGYPDCTGGVSRDGRHVLYKARKGPLAGVFIYGDLLTKQTVRWKSPEELSKCNAMEFAWVETPADAEPGAAP